MKIKLTLIAFCIGSLLMIGCGDDDPVSDNGEGGSGNQGGTTSLTPAQQKSKMESIGTEFINKFNIDDHKALAELLDYFTTKYAEYDLEEDLISTFTPILTQGMENVLKGNLTALSGLGDPESEIYRLDDYYGIYVPNESDRMWVKTGTQDRMIEINFKNAKGQPCVFRLTDSGDKKEVEISGEESVIAFIPEKLEFVIIENGVNLAKLEITSQFGGSVDLNVILRTYKNNATNYTLGSHTIVSENQGKTTFNVLYNNNGISESLLQTTVDVKGDFHESFETIKDSDHPENYFEDATFNVMVLGGRMNVKGNCDNIASLVKTIQTADDNDRNEAVFKNSVTKINDLLKIKIFYDNTQEIQAYCVQEAIQDPYGYWDFETNIQFTSDNSKYSFDSYFGGDQFGTLIERAKDLMERFENFFK